MGQAVQGSAGPQKRACSTASALRRRTRRFLRKASRPNYYTAIVVLNIPSRALVLLVGASGSGKSTFARKHFKSTEIVSSDGLRAAVSDDEADQSASGDAFEVLRLITGKRLRRGRLTVIDATNVQRDSRRSLLAIAAPYGMP